MAGEMLNGVALWLTRKERKEERDDAAIQAVLVAVTATQTYSAALGRGEPASHKLEADLAQQWVRAAVAIRRTDPALAQRLQLKAEYWTNPRSWSERDVEATGIKLRQVSEEARTLLGTRS